MCVFSFHTHSHRVVVVGSKFESRLNRHHESATSPSRVTCRERFCPNLVPQQMAYSWLGLRSLFGGILSLSLPGEDFRTRNTRRLIVFSSCRELSLWCRKMLTMTTRLFCRQQTMTMMTALPTTAVAVLLLALALMEAGPVAAFVLVPKTTTTPATASSSSSSRRFMASTPPTPPPSDDDNNTKNKDQPIVSNEDFPPAEELSGSYYSGSVDWDAEWKKVVQQESAKRKVERPGQGYYKSDAEIAAIRAANQASQQMNRMQASMQLPSWNSVKGDWKVRNCCTFIVANGEEACNGDHWE